MIERLATIVAPAQDRALAKLPLPPLDERVAALRALRRTRGHSRRRRGPTFGAIAVAAALACLYWRTRAVPLVFDVGPTRDRGVVGARVEAPASGPLTLRFSDGTEMVLGDNSRARVVSVEPRGAHVVIERGVVRATVVPRAGAAWIVAVGPFDVQVKGTRFDAAWDPTREFFTLKMEEGAVVITSRCLPSPRSSIAGEVLELSCAAPAAGVATNLTAGVPTQAPANVALHVRPAALPIRPAFARPGFAPSGPGRAVAKSTERPRPAGLEPPALSVPASAPGAYVAAEAFPATPWQRSLARGNALAALALLETSRVDLGEACDTLAPAALMDLGEVARSSGRSASAVQIYRAVRARFPGSEVAAIAAFHMGQVAFDQHGTLVDARRGFAAYLEESPEGPLAQEALGRLLEIEQRAGEARASRELARRYLDRFPNGPHAALARAVSVTATGAAPSRAAP